MGILELIKVIFIVSTTKLIVAICAVFGVGLVVFVYVSDKIEESQDNSTTSQEEDTNQASGEGPVSDETFLQFKEFELYWGAVFFFKICSHIFMIFEVKSKQEELFETGSGAKKRLVLRREFFLL